MLGLDNKEPSISFKILLIGPSGVGKSSLLVKYVHGKFTYDYSVTSGVEFYTKSAQVNERTTVNLQIWDTMGQEAFKSIVKSHYKGVAAILLFYEIDRHDSYEKLGTWLREIRDNTHDETVIYLVGTKLDLEDVRKVTKEEGEVYARSIGAAGFIEVSAKTGENIKQLFDKLSKALYKKFQSNKSFKELVKPISSSYQKADSFALRNFTAGNRKDLRASKCC